MDSPLSVYLLGFSAQVFYGARALVQWIASEKHHRIESPDLYWILSVAGSAILIYYGMLRLDFSVVIGEFVAFYIYMWNMAAKGMLRKNWLKIALGVIPLVLVSIMLKDFSAFKLDFFDNPDMPLALLAFGLIGQFLIKFRFVYQWVYSVAHKESLMPVSFWAITAVGSLLLIVYALIRHDWVVLFSQVGIVPAVRNIMIGQRK